MKLIRNHQPQSKYELEQLIERHFREKCACGVRSQGSVTDFGDWLYQAQFEFWGEARYDQNTCRQWEYDLFVTQSLKGGQKEREAIEYLGTAFPQLDFQEAQGYLDEELRIDLLVQQAGETIAGIQVKPLSFTRMPARIAHFNKLANQKWGKPVLYLFYEEKGAWWRIREFCRNLEEICS